LTEVERFFRHLVRILAATDTAQLRRPIPLVDIRQRIVPYRTHRRALELESSEDYELILMRLCAGEEELARIEPEEVRAEFQSEIRSSNPDLDIVHRHQNAVVWLEHQGVARALGPKPEHAFAPPDHPADPDPNPDPVPFLTGHPEPLAAPDSQAAAPGDHLALQCTHCQGSLPSGRPVNFCPHCGRSQLLSRCPLCETELEDGWRHCVSCGYKIGDG